MQQEKAKKVWKNFNGKEEIVELTEKVIRQGLFFFQEVNTSWMISELASDKTCENNFKIGGGFTIQEGLHQNRAGCLDK